MTTTAGLSANGPPLRVALVSESFLPQVNGVTNSVLRVCEHLAARGHDVLVVAPGPGPTRYGAARVVRTPSVPLPGYTDFRLSRPWSGLRATLEEFQPDLVHLASPAVLGAQAALTARGLGVPVVAVYQTDLAGFAGRYGLAGAERTVWRWLRGVHSLAGTNLAPSRHAVAELQRNGVRGVARWARGVDLNRFHPRRRDEALRAQLSPDGRPIVGYVGRLAQEKQVSLLSEVHALPDIQLVVVGDGPQRAALQRQLPNARFLGFQGGDALATTFASLDVFVHTGAHETFCQAAQEAKASGLPIVAPSAGGLLDLVEPGVTGLWFRPGDALDLGGQVAALAGAELRASMGAAARRSVAGRSWTVVGDELLGHYGRALRAATVAA